MANRLYFITFYSYNEHWNQKGFDRLNVKTSLFENESSELHFNTLSVLQQLQKVSLDSRATLLSISSSISFSANYFVSGNFWMMKALL